MKFNLNFHSAEPSNSRAHRHLSAFKMLPDLDITACCFLSNFAAKQTRNKASHTSYFFAAIQFHPKCQFVLFEAPSPCGCRNAFENGNPLNTLMAH